MAAVAVRPRGRAGYVTVIVGGARARCDGEGGGGGKTMPNGEPRLDAAAVREGEWWRTKWENELRA